MATLKKTENCFFKTNYRLMQVKSIAECSQPSLSYRVIKIFVLSIFEWQFYRFYCILKLMKKIFAILSSEILFIWAFRSLV